MRALCYSRYCKTSSRKQDTQSTSSVWQKIEESCELLNAPVISLCFKLIFGEHMHEAVIMFGQHMHVILRVFYVVAALRDSSLVILFRTSLGNTPKYFK